LSAAREVPSGREGVSLRYFLVTELLDMRHDRSDIPLAPVKSIETPQNRYQRYRAALRYESLPVAFVDLDAVDENVDTLLAPVRRTGKTLRIATKSIRCVELIRYLVKRGGSAVRGLMAYSPAEAEYLVENGFQDILIAYPTAQAKDAQIVAEANRNGARVSIAVDALEHLEVLDAAAHAAQAIIPVVVDIDVSLRPWSGRLHVGVRRSPIHQAHQVGEFVAAMSQFRHLSFAGLLGYEAHIAGVPDDAPLGPLGSSAKRAVKRVAGETVVSLRQSILHELEKRGASVSLFNGGGTGSVAFSVADPALTEVTAGSGFLDSHLFDRYDGLSLSPAAFFALQVTRKPAKGFVTCQGGGFVASGAPGADRLPMPYLPSGLSLLSLEGAGEVQTPLAVPEGTDLPLGHPVFFRHAKAGELAAHFPEYLLVRKDRIESRAKTYCGAGQWFH
jgi:D-serine deaminase-like pyridoxal phosphate-dependent protein